MSNIAEFNYGSVTFQAALCVLAGLYGNGDERMINLKADGHNASRVQSCVNDLVKVAEKYA